MNQNIIDDLKKFNWQTVVDFGLSLDDLDEAQFRMNKGYALERAIEKHSNDSTFKYVGAVHRDYDWDKYNIVAELKSQMSERIYYVRGKDKGKLKPLYKIKLTNSNGTNKRLLAKHEIADIILVPKSDGVIAIAQDTAFKGQILKGDGVEVVVDKSQVIELTGPMTQKTVYATGLKNAIEQAIISRIP